MTDVPEHLVPMDGLTNSFIRYAGFDTIEDSGSATHRFDIYDEDSEYLSTFRILVHPTDASTVDGMIAAAHRQFSDILRQWLYEADTGRQAFEK